MRGVVRAALVGWAGMTGLIAGARLLRLGWTDLIGIEGAFFAEPNTKKARAIGAVVHLGMCLWIAAAYRLGFRLLGLRPSWKSGAFVAVIHWLIASMVAALVTKTHPKRDALDLPGWGGMTLGLRSVLGWLVSHLVFGMLVGWQYGRDGEA